MVACDRDGADVGTLLVGYAVGANEGLLVSSGIVGADVWGLLVGEEEGTEEGTLSGVKVGDAIGVLVGCPVGWPEGCVDGCPVGSPVGWPEGCVGGWPVGSSTRENSKPEEELKIIDEPPLRTPLNAYDEVSPCDMPKLFVSLNPFEPNREPFSSDDIS